jgi:hypothetical protein
MFAHVLWFSAAIIGIEAGWQPLPEGGMEYIIQLDSQTLELLKAGETIQSDIPPSAGEVRSYRIVSGTKILPRINPPASQDQAAKSPRTLLPDPAEKPLKAQSAAFIEPAQNPAKSQATSPNQSETAKDDLQKPWMPLILVSLGLFASLGGNVYLTWLFADLRRRYRKLLEA